MVSSFSHTSFPSSQSFWKIWHRNEVTTSRLTDYLQTCILFHYNDISAFKAFSEHLLEGIPKITGIALWDQQLNTSIHPTASLWVYPPRKIKTLASLAGRSVMSVISLPVHSVPIKICQSWAISYTNSCFLSSFLAFNTQHSHSKLLFEIGESSYFSVVSDGCLAHLARVNRKMEQNGNLPLFADLRHVKVSLLLPYP